MTKGIVLCGFMGAGKTHVGRYLARSLRYRFEDLDEIITSGSSMSIADMFARHGEAFFRQIERNYLRIHLGDTRRILSLGGGALQTQELIDEVKKSNILVFINPSFDIVLKRIAGKSKRPLVLDSDGNPKSLSQLRADLFPLYEKRLMYYKQAHIELIPQETWSPAESASELLKCIKTYDVTSH